MKLHMLKTLQVRGNESLYDFVTRYSSKQGVWSSKWFASGDMEVYIRAGDQHNRELGIHKSVVIANITVDQSKRRRGLFKTFLGEVEELAKSLECLSVRVECIHNPLLRDYLARRGYSIEKGTEEVPTMFLPL